MAITLPPRPSAFTITTETPCNVDEESGLTSRSVVRICDLDGGGRTWRLQASCAKVIIYNSKNATLRVESKVLTSTIELWGCYNFTLVLAVPCGVLQLDPNLTNVTIKYNDASSSSSSIVVAPRRTPTSSSTFGFRSVKLSGEQDDFVLADERGVLCQSGNDDERLDERTPMDRIPEQLVVKLDKVRGWAVEALRREKNWPVNAST